MTTRADLRASLRIRLEDPTPNPLWSDTILHEFLIEALHRYSARLPAQESATVFATGGELVLPVNGPARARDIVRVRLPNATLLPPAIEDDHAPGWFFWNGALRLNAPTVAGDWTIDYYALRQLPDDDIGTIALPPGDSEIVVLFAAVSALLRRSVETGKRGMESSSLALVRIAESYERAADHLISVRCRRAIGSSFASFS